MNSNVKVYQKYLVMSIKVGCATRSLYASLGPKAEGVSTNNQKGQRSGPCRLLGGIYDWDIVDCVVKQPISLNKKFLATTPFSPQSILLPFYRSLLSNPNIPQTII